MAENFFDYHSRRGRARARGAGDPPPQSPPAAAALTVSQLTARIQAALRSLPERLLVRGELSNANRHGPSGHIYFTLKDEHACVDCVMFRSDAARLKFEPRDGMEVLASGRVDVYAARGRYQLYVSRLEPLGQGALELAFRQLRDRLQAEGLFDPARKKPIPPYPRRIVLLTSTETAALADMLKVLRRFPFIRTLVYHVPVQGEGAAQEIAAAIETLNRRSRDIGGADLMLLARGGGSLEDLWAFNEEVVARAIVASRIPIVTGIGHEVDTTIADLVADLRAHTPTEAAQVAAARWRTARDDLDALGIRLRREVRALLAEARQRLGHIARHEFFRRPAQRIEALRQLLDDRQRALSLAAVNRLRRAQQRLARFAGSIREHHPRHLAQLARQRLVSLRERAARAAAELLRTARARLQAASSHLNAVGPLQVLRRGYTITTLRSTGAPVRRSGELRPGQRIVTRFADGTVQSVVEDQRQLPLFE